ncbi:hypothetical protein IPC65_24210 [Pseudomonas aeruginosa]|jgi:hypothetical protein|uniref:hypothetical protein n=1 Tax=Pseudomonas TaxID=286 RepID=UPI001068720E|nr:MULTISPECIES: hypothetical protein [Pseudomonas]MQT40059.1 hypothetical protein [Pseudomonas sp. FSL R10-0765]MQT50903.1 hypothetical protein [Pseudomonas sp. FSL R10-2398]TEP98125.1 hypothetical protein IPC64_09725 [Pseudomonas aeruginosa]TEQ00659.1 hypothetical protein IPC65_24210 [Pseudomonas aeruginosa]TEQ11033.1 hypothetical protein IPC66_19030 [Pseudomonas aeruginosa]
MIFMKIDRAKIFEYVNARFNEVAPLTSAALDNIKRYSVQKHKDKIVLVGEFEVQGDDLDSTITIFKNGNIKLEYFMFGIPAMASSTYKIVDVYEAIERQFVSIVLGQVNDKPKDSPSRFSLDAEQTVDFIARTITFDFHYERGI